MMRMLLIGLLVGWAALADDYVDYRGAPVPVIQGVPETQAEIGRTYPELRLGYQRLIENGLCEMFPEFTMPYRVTPHVEWAKPLAGGPVRILVCKTPSFGDPDLREIRERLDCTITLLTCPQGRSEKPEVLAWANARNLELLDRDYDVVILTPSLYMKGVDDAVREKLLAKVRNGLGAIVLTGGQYADNPLFTEVCAISPGQSNYFPSGAALLEPGVSVPATAHPAVAGVPWGALPPLRIWSAKVREGATVLAELPPPEHGRYRWPIALTSTCGKARVLTYGYDNHKVIGPFFLPAVDQWARPGRYWEYPAMMFIRGLMWAAGREPAVQVGIDAPDTVPWGQKLPLTVTLSGRVAVLEIGVRDVACNTVRAFTAPPGTVDLGAELPVGQYTVDAIARDGKGNSLGFAAASFAVVDDAELTLTAAPQYAGPGSPAALAATLARGPGGLATLTVTDTWGRLLERRQVTVGDGRTDLGKIATDTARGRVVLVRLDLPRAGKPWLAATVEIYRPSFTWDDWKLVYWPENQQGYFSAEEMAMYRELGVDALYLPVWDHRVDAYRRAALENIEIVAAAAARCARNPVEDQQKHEHHVLRDPDSAAAQAKYLAPAAAEIRKYGCIWASMADEPHLAYGENEVGYSDHFLGLERDWLKHTYGDLAGLNQAWNTGFAAWDDVRPDFIADALKRDGNFAPWIDHKVFVDQEFAKAYDEFQGVWDNVVGIDVPCGPDGLFGFQQHYIPAGGMDYARLCKTGRRFCFYGAEWGKNPIYGHGKVWNIVRSFCPEWQILTLTSGSVYTDFPTLYHDAWFTAFNGGSGYLVYKGNSHIYSGGAYWRRGVATADATRELRHGIGKLLMQAHREPAQVGILYVHPSYYLTWLTGKQEGRSFYFNYQNSRYAFERMCIDSQTPFRYVRWTAPGAAELAGLKVLVLTGCDMLGDDWAAAIREFVRNGGIVVADLAPGWYDMHGRPRQGGVLDDLFGISRTANRLIGTSPQFNVGLTKPETLGTLVAWPCASVFEESVKVADGEALGVYFANSLPPALDDQGRIRYGTDSLPAFVRKPTGDGYALLFNFLPESYVQYPDDHLLRIFTAVCRQGGVTRSSHVARPESPGDATNGLIVNRFVADGGQVEHLAILREQAFSGNVPAALTAVFAAPGYVYDIRAGKCLGQGREFPVAIPTTPDLGARLLTRLPYRVTELRWDAPRRAKAGRTWQAHVSPDAKATATHVYRVDVTDPTGDPVIPYSGNVVAPHGQGTITIPFALNDRPGDWTLTVRDVVTGCTKAQTIRVAAP